MLRLVLALSIVLTSPAISVPDAYGSDRYHRLHERIDHAKSVSKRDKDRLHRTVDSVRTETAKVQEAQALVDKLRAEVRSDSENARIKADIRKQLDRVEEGRATLSSIARTLMSEIESSRDLTSRQKAAFKKILRDLAEKRITERQAEIAVEEVDVSEDEGHSGYAGGFVLILSLFILLPIIGAGFGLDYRHY